MFSRNKVSERSAAATPPIPPKRSNARTAPSIISSDLAVHGDMTAAGDIQIDGTVEGDVRSQSLTVGEKASVTGEVTADDVMIRGRVIGSVRGRRVQLASTCHVEGDIIHETLAVETGAFFEGNCKHSDDPLGLGAEAKQVAAKPNGGAGPAKPAAGDGPVAVKESAVAAKQAAQ